MTTIRFNEGAYLPDLEHPINVGPCPDCSFDVYAALPHVTPIHFACDMNRHYNTRPLEVAHG